MVAQMPGNDEGQSICALPSPTAAIEALRLLIATDTFPRGGLYAGFYCASAAVRYEVIWLSVLREHISKGGSNCPLPPLDVAFAWFVHRQFPVSYVNSTIRQCGRAFHPPREAAFAFGNGEEESKQRKQGTDSANELWKTVAGEMPLWPPPAAGSDFDLVTGNNDWRPTLSSQLSASMSRFSPILHSWLRPQFLDPLFLDRARNRYGRFLELLIAHPELTLVPAADIALMWHTHMGLSDDYAAFFKAAGGGGVPIRPLYLDLDGTPLRVAYSSTARWYEQAFGEPYDSPDTAWVRPSEPHPLAGPASPVAFALLRSFDEVPSAITAAGDDNTANNLKSIGSGYTNGILSPNRRLSGQSPRSGAMRYNTTSPRAASTRSQGTNARAHPRAGGHALFAAWLASSSASSFFDVQTCRGLCFRSSWSIKVASVEKMVTSLVLLPYMRGLPSSSNHPFLLAVTQRRGLWQPLTRTEQATEERGQGNGDRDVSEVRGTMEVDESRPNGDGCDEGTGGWSGNGDGVTESADAVAGGVSAGVSGACASTGASGVAAVTAAAPDGSGCPSPLPGQHKASATDLQGTQNSPRQARQVAAGDDAGGDKERGVMYSGCCFQLYDAEEFVNDDPMRGLSDLMAHIVAAGDRQHEDPMWWRAPREEDEDDEEELRQHSSRTGITSRAGRASPRRQLNNSGGDGRSSPGGSGGGDDTGGNKKYLNSGSDERLGGDTAPLWGILRKPEYINRARALFRHLWGELGRQGLEHPLLQQQ